jgi:nickel-dependent lactate racemase
MQVGISYGRNGLDMQIPENGLLPLRRDPPLASLADPASAVAQALEEPLGFPALRRALTPDDHVAIVLDSHLPDPASLLTPVLEHVGAAGVLADAITIVLEPGASAAWQGDLAERFRKARFEVHDPADRRHLSYLATTRRGRRVYLNRSTVDADQAIVLARRTFDPLLGYSGSEGALYPVLSDETTRQEMCGLVSLTVPGDKPWPARREAAEVAWLLGAPFMIHLVEGSGDEISHVVSGLVDTGAESIRLLNARWRASLDGLADTVIAGISGDPGRHTFADLAAALACAARIVRPEGRILLLTDALPNLGPGAELLRQIDSPQEALKLLRQQAPLDMAAAFQWASAAQRATIYLLSKLSTEIAEELFTTPLDHPSQVQRLLQQAKSVAVVPDANKTLVVPTNLPHE